MNWEQAGIAFSAVGGICGAIWGYWRYKRERQPRLLVVCRIGVVKTTPDTKVRDGISHKPIAVRPGEIMGVILSIAVHNIGPVLITINDIAVTVRGRNFHKRWLPLVDCWHFVQEENMLPKVVPPGEKWVGDCDYLWLRDRLQRTFGPGPWPAVVTVNDINNDSFEGEVTISDEVVMATDPGALRYLADVSRLPQRQRS